MGGHRLMPEIQRCLLAMVLVSSVLPAAELYVSDVNAARILKFTSSGTQSTFATNVDAVFFAFDSGGNLFATDEITDDILEFTPGGTRSVFSASTKSGFTGLAFDA